MSSNASGAVGEELTAEYLRCNGFEVIERNWKTKYCEIDIVAKKGGRVYFVEVKARSNNRWGSGFDYITPKKLKQMSFAAEMWVHNQKWSGEYQLAAASVDNGAVTFIDEL